MVACSGIYDRWWVVTLILCSYGFFKEMRPSEPYLTESLTKYNNITKEEAYQQVYPVWTYAYLALLVVVFLFTDLVRYKPMILFEGLGYMATWMLLIWGSGVRQMQLMEFLYGIATSTEVAYFTYIYARVDREHHQRVTGYVRAALLLGRFASGVLSQTLVSSGVLTFYQLNYISFSSVSVAFCIALCLPPARHSFYFYRRTTTDAVVVRDNSSGKVGNAETASDQSSREDGGGKLVGDDRLWDDHDGPGNEAAAGSGRSTECLSPAEPPTERPPEDPHLTFIARCRRAASYLAQDARTAYSTPSVVQWSVWWAFATCGNLQVGNYIQPLWEEIAPWEDFDTEGALYNGLVEASNTLLGALAAFTLGHLRLNWSFLGEPTLALFSAINGCLLLTMALTSYIGVAYVTYVFFRIIYQMLITICSFQVALAIPPDSYGLVFGINTFFALLLETLLTVAVVNKGGFELAPRPQFQVYGGYFLDLALLFVILLIVTIRRRGWQQWRSQSVWLPRPSPVTAPA